MHPTRKLKKPQTSCSKFDLEEIIGLTTTNGNGLASSFYDSKFVYIAGCVVVLYDVDLGTQSHLIVSNRSPKPLTCVAVSQDGSYVAAGESGHQPAIVVWSSATLASVSELKGHRYGVACMAFSPDGKHLVSVGFPQDGYLCLWDWRSGRLVKKLKACSSFSAVASVSFSVDANFILTAGKRHLKTWTVGLPTKSRAKTDSLSPSMHGKTVNLGHHKGCTFIAITSSLKTKGNLADGKSGELVLVYALTDSGVLCLLHGGLTITHSVNLKVEKGYALSASREFIACACNNGVVKLYTVGSLGYAGSLQYSEDKQSNKTSNTQCHSEVSQEGIQHPPTFPDAIACQFSNSEKLVVVYRDHSLYIWNIHGKFQATKCCVLVSHSACIWDVQNLSCENMHDPSLACVARGCNGGVSFATCSADGTIRLWDLALQSEPPEPVGTSCLVGAGTFERESVVSGVITQGYRSMAVSSDGKHLAAGDSDGNLHIFNLNTTDYTCIQDVHKAEILSLDFSLPIKKKMNSAEDLESYYFLASGGGDRMIQLFDVNRNFDLIASIDDHSAAVTSVKLTGNGRKIISCSSDRSLILRDVAGRGMEYDISHSHQHIASCGTVYDIAMDPTTETAVTVGQDKRINMFDIAAGQVIRSFKQSGDFGDPIKVVLDPSCSYLVCSYSDKSICMYDFMSGEMVAFGMGHGEAINGIIFLPDCKHLVSVGSDGCIFIWKVPTLLTSRMLQRIKEKFCSLSPSTIAQCAQINYFEENYLRSQRTARAVLCEGKCPQETSTFRFSVSRLPQWAKSKVTSPLVIPMDPILCEVAEREDHSPSKSLSGGNAPVDLVLHTPSNHNTERFTRSSSSGTSNSKASTTQGACRSFALDKRWLTIHTVCLDLLNSPEAYNTKERSVPLSSNLSQSHALETTDIESMNHGAAKFCLSGTSYNHHDVEPAACLNVHIGLNDSACLSNIIGQHQCNEASDSPEEFTHGSSEQLQLSTSVNQIPDNCILNSGNNSANFKVTSL
ncbi:mitogen-activated protein kinase-binding protein 1 [Cynara cardunculus var. scolymus]|uniref:mitogen-activated protein kinase-binding protein 1 n=1 Tax=Cynara cardunculus var. scolymus TaxID=59895 RepID=UPI000D6265A3|nr:mitogen-activated protein kinase-binding protein 1 [Cynara cardunculus var. scolymus]